MSQPLLTHETRMTIQGEVRAAFEAPPPPLPVMSSGTFQWLPLSTGWRKNGLSVGFDT